MARLEDLLRGLRAEDLPEKYADLKPILTAIDAAVTALGNAFLGNITLSDNVRVERIDVQLTHGVAQTVSLKKLPRAGSVIGYSCGTDSGGTAHAFYRPPVVSPTSTPGFAQVLARFWDNTAKRVACTIWIAPDGVTSSKAPSAQPLPVVDGGTGSSTQNFVDLTTNQTVGGNKTWTGVLEVDLGGTGPNANQAVNIAYTGTGTGSGNRLFFLPNAANGSYNNAVTPNDFAVVSLGTAVDTGVLVLTTHSNTPSGLRIKYDGTNVFTGSVTWGRIVLTYSATIATNAAVGNSFSITATNGTAFTISNPTNLVTGQRVLYTIRNTSGGALGAITWGGTFKMAAWVSPATANSRSTEFVYDGTNLIQLWQSAADVPN